MPKGVPTLTRAPLVKGQRVGAWYFYGVQPWEPLDRNAPVRPAADGSVGVRVTLARGPGSKGPYIVAPPGGEPVDRVQPTEWVQLQVRWRKLDDPHPFSVALVVDTDAGVELGPKVLARFPWATWLTVADAAARQIFDPDNHPHELDGMFTPGGADGTNLRRRSRRAKAPAVKRPGSAGHGDDFYLGIAERYVELRMSGNQKPTQTIADEAGYNRSTAARWVHIARAKGFLKPGRPGRPGG